MNGIAPSSPLRRFAQGRPRAAAAPSERCELCAEAIAAEHRHLLDVPSRALRCVCRACAILFDRSVTGGAHYRLIPERYRKLDASVLDDGAWERLGIPVETVFFFSSTPVEHVVAFYPSPIGAMESRLDLAAWDDLAAANPVLSGMEPDVEAFLVHRARGAREHWVVPVDACYRLVGIVRTNWRGFTGGREVWAEIGRFFATLEQHKEERWRRS